MSIPWAEPCVLDFDHAVGALPGERRFHLHDWQEKIRFGCRARDLDALFSQVGWDASSRGPVFLGSGDYHHVTWPLVRSLGGDKGSMDVVVLDNHPDNMRYPWGVHCGSWVRQVAALPAVRRVHVLGITSTDIAIAHLWENYLTPLYRNKLIYWSLGVDVEYARWLGLGAAVRGFANISDLLAAFNETVNLDRVYLSIDKDVLDAQEIRTNWDQGCLSRHHLFALIQQLRGKLVGCYITGEVSLYSYQRWWKRQLSRIDGQHEHQPKNLTELQQWQRDQHDLNLEILKILQGRSNPCI